jgi:hypothetical protein
MLKFWKKRAIRSFLSWLRAKYKDLAELNKEYARCAEHRDGGYYFVELSRNASLKERGKVGLAGYREWWWGTGHRLHSGSSCRNGGARESLLVFMVRLE